MKLRPIEELDLSDPEAVAEYEAAFYEAFCRVSGNKLIRSLWIWDDVRGRLRTRIPYEDQVVIIQRQEDGPIAAACSINVALRDLQSAAFGFSIPPGETGVCEFLAHSVLAGHGILERLDMLRQWYGALRAKNLTVAYATTAARSLRFYERLGGVVVDNRKISGEERFFLRFSLDRDFMKR